MDYTQCGHKMPFQKREGGIPWHRAAHKVRCGVPGQVCNRGHDRPLRYNPRMIEIRRIQPHEWPVAKRIVYRVAYFIFKETRPLEEMIADFDSRGTLDDMHDIQKNYFDNGGIFLVITLGAGIIGTGAIRKWDGDVCELKRLWLLPDYHGQGLGYRMLQELLTFARKKGYRHMRLETDAVAQSRAVEFYRRIGFKEIPVADATPDEDILMEMAL
jgi:putative acetyltransferase